MGFQTAAREEPSSPKPAGSGAGGRTSRVISVNDGPSSFSSFLGVWRDTGDNERIAALSEGTFWLVLPTLPLFLVLPAMLRQGVAFWPALLVACALTIALYLLTIWLLPRLGIDF